MLETIHYASSFLNGNRKVRLVYTHHPGIGLLVAGYVVRRTVLQAPPTCTAYFFDNVVADLETVTEQSDVTGAERRELQVASRNPNEKR